MSQIHRNESSAARLRGLACLATIAVAAALSFAQDASPPNSAASSKDAAALKDLPHGSIAVIGGGTTYYYYSGGVFYTRQQSGFVVVNTPIGVIVPQPPPGATRVEVNGETMFFYNGIHYRPAFQNGVTVYTTVRL